MFHPAPLVLSLTPFPLSILICIRALCTRVFSAIIIYLWQQKCIVQCHLNNLRSSVAQLASASDCQVLQSGGSWLAHAGE
ncbi:hypothetical protein P154DRAFT_520857 [Amniculicola lignicola CBS 123094]|uniref:Uncharacterized protein n=1 Tax=Amniculicola lignicola CBS 123094 TaxID=1392246 RepID=A0A6A5WPP8_9PLEO|nr:hypothetical protein P154DRAFT_520857 [Amniculicola lignicola CBS 123094]